MCVCMCVCDCACKQSKKGSAIKSLIRREFEKARDETDPEKIEGLKTKYALDCCGVWCVAEMLTTRWLFLYSAIRGLSNYLVLANSRCVCIHSPVHMGWPLTALSLSRSLHAQLTARTSSSRTP